MSNVSVGREVRRAGAPQGSETGVVVQCYVAPMPDITALPTEEAATQLNVWRGLPAQITVFWQGGDLVPARTEHLMSNEVELDNPRSSYRAGDYGFPLFAVDTDGYADLGVRHPDGTEVVRINWLNDESGEDPSDPAVWRARLHRLIDAYCDKGDQQRIEHPLVEVSRDQVEPERS